uniref:Uncharacterized protein n=1 Tax=Oryza brachyantha TaxID=4533 RepID=J3LK77_ORYBR
MPCPALHHTTRQGKERKKQQPCDTCVWPSPINPAPLHRSAVQPNQQRERKRRVRKVAENWRKKETEGKKPYSHEDPPIASHHRRRQEGSPAAAA